MPRRKKAEERSSGGLPEWMATYGDMVTLLLTFFILLFSFSTIDAQKWRSLVRALGGREIKVERDQGGSKTPLLPAHDKKGNSFPETSRKPIKEIPKEKPPEEPDEFGQLYKKIQRYVTENKLNARIELNKSETGILIRFKDNVLFDSGRADLKKEAVRILGDISVVLRASQRDIQMIRIEGHTDDVPIRTSQFPTNWELSTTRAVNVLRFFIQEKGLDPAKLSAVGYGQYHPIRKNNSEESKAKNRRVDLVISKIKKA